MGDLLRFRLRHVDTEGPFPFELGGDCTRVMESLRNMETRTHSEVFVSAKKHNHRIPLSGLCPDAQARLGELGRDDLDELISLRVTGKQRVWT